MLFSKHVCGYQSYTADTSKRDQVKNNVEEFLYYTVIECYSPKKDAY